MTTEDNFHAMLEAHPDDHGTRRVFADWLRERGDPRAEGYRALGSLHLYAWKGNIQFAFADYASKFTDALLMPDRSELPRDWYFELKSARARPPIIDSDGTWVGYPSRSEAEDAAALAFTRLPADRRAELLAGQADAAPV